MFATKPLFAAPAEQETQSAARARKQQPCDAQDDGAQCGEATTSAPQRSAEEEAAAKAANEDRARRRARARVRDLALANEFTHFVTLTLDQRQTDRYDMQEIGRRLRRWLSNQVQRRGLRYVLVPERHKDGAIHFHGLMAGGLELVDSGHTDRQGHKVYNLLDWKLGYSTAIALYGNYAQAVSYTCKYIGKQGEKPGGRWYYSGGDLAAPKCVYGVAEDWAEARALASAFGPMDAEAYTFSVPEAGFSCGIIRQNM